VDDLFELYKHEKSIFNMDRDIVKAFHTCFNKEVTRNIANNCMKKVGSDRTKLVSDRYTIKNHLRKRIRIYSKPIQIIIKIGKQETQTIDIVNYLLCDIRLMFLP